MRISSTRTNKFIIDFSSPEFYIQRLVSLVMSQSLVMIMDFTCTSQSTAMYIRKHENLVSPCIARGWGDCNHIVFQALESRDASGVAVMVSLRCATPLERHQQQSYNRVYHRPRSSITRSSFCALHQPAPRLMGAGQPTRSAQECSKPARKTPRCCRLPIPHAALPQRYNNR